MAFTVLYDANVLYPAPHHDLLVRLGQTRLVRVRCTDDILDEVFRTPGETHARRRDTAETQNPGSHPTPPPSTGRKRRARRLLGVGPSTTPSRFNV